MLRHRRNFLVPFFRVFIMHKRMWLVGLSFALLLMICINQGFLDPFAEQPLRILKSINAMETIDTSRINESAFHVNSDESQQEPGSGGTPKETQNKTVLTEWLKTQNNRLSLLNDGCKDISKEEAFRDLMKKDNFFHLLVDDRHKVLYCYIPKIACTNWKRMMLIMTGTINAFDPMQISHDQAHTDFAKISLYDQINKVNESQLEHKLKTYKKFLIVRNPMERLLSAYRDKLENTRKRNPYYWNIGFEMAKKVRNKFDMNLEQFDGLSFVEFISYLVQYKDNDEHFQPYYNICHPCALNYQYIAKYDTINEDSKHILQEIGAPEYLQFPLTKNTNTSDLLNSYIKNLSTRMMLDIYKKYHQDFTLYGYNRKFLKMYNDLTSKQG